MIYWLAAFPPNPSANAIPMVFPEPAPVIARDEAPVKNPTTLPARGDYAELGIILPVGFHIRCPDTSHFP